jgi:hypothetical protein
MIFHKQQMVIFFLKEKKKSNFKFVAFSIEEIKYLYQYVKRNCEQTLIKKSPNYVNRLYMNLKIELQI